MHRYLWALGLLLPSFLGAEDYADEAFEAQIITIYGQRGGASTQMLEARELEAIRLSGSLKDALSAVAGMDVQGLSGAKNFGKLAIRGAESSHTVVILNGQKLGQDFDLGSIPTEDLERVEILKGPEALAYSGEALGGVLLLSTREAVGERKAWSLGASLGNYSTGQAQLRSPDLVLGPYRGSLSAHGFSTAGYTENTDEQVLILEQNSSLKLLDDHWRLKFSYLERHGGIPLAKSLASAGSGEVDNDDREHRYSFGGNLSDQRRLGEASFKPALDYSYSSVRRLNPSGDDADAGVPLDNLDKTLRYGLRLPLSWHTEGRRFNLELEGGQESLESGTTGWHARDKAALSVRGRQALPGYLNLELSGRTDYQSGFGVDFLPVGSLSFEPSPGRRFSLSAGQGRRVPELEQLFRSTQPFLPTAEAEWGSGEKGNPNLKAEHSLKAQAVLDLQEDFGGLNLAGYQDLVSDLISLSLDPADNYWTFRNLGPSKIYGGEGSLSLHLGAWDPFANYTYVEARTETGDLVPGRLRQKIGYGTSWQVHPKLQARLEHHYTERNGNISPYWNLNAALSAKAGENARVFVNGINLTDYIAEYLPGMHLRGRYVEAGTKFEF